MQITADLLISLIPSLVLLAVGTFLFWRQGSQKDDLEKILKLDKKLKTKIAKQIQEEADVQLKNVLDAVSKRLEVSVNGMVGSLTESSNKQVVELANFVREQQKVIVKESQFMLASAIDKAEKELSDYKQKRQTEINVKIFEIVRLAAKEVLGKNINPNENEKLVEDAIERAKQQKFFS